MASQIRRADANLPPPGGTTGLDTSGGDHRVLDRREHIEGRKMTAGVRGLYLGSASSWSRAGKALRP
jgi:hypothetical protein